MNSFIQNRIKNNEFVGLPLTIIILLILLILSTFIGLTEAVVNSHYITKVDMNFTQYLFDHRSSSLVLFFYIITQFGSWKVVGVLIPLSIGALFYYKKRDLLLPMIISIAGAEITTSLIKLAAHRARPGQTIAYYLEKSFSFPSGHATIAVAFYGFLIYFFMRTVRAYRSSFYISLVLGILILLIGFSRIYLGVHYLSDVLGGYLVGGLWLLLAISLREILGYRRSKLV